MADNLIPEVETGQGAAPRSGYNPGPDYRSVQAPEQVRTDLPSSGAAARAAALSQTFKQFEDASGKLYNEAATQAGGLAGAASGNTGHPDYKTGLARFTAYSQAFNNAATGAYAIEAEAQIDDDATRLRIAANKNPDTFAATFTASRDAAIKEAPPFAVPMLTEKYNEKLALGIAAIRGDQMTEQREQQAKVQDEGIGRQTTRVADLLGSTDPAQQALAAVEQAKLNVMIEGGFNSGLYSQQGAESRRIEAQRTIMKQVVTTQFDRELAGGDAAAYIEHFRQLHIADLADTSKPPALSEPEYDQLSTMMKQQLQLKHATMYYAKMEAAQGDDAKLKAGDREYTAKMADGSLTAAMIGPAVRNGELSPEVGRAMIGALQRGPEPKSDPKAVFRAYSNPDVLNWTPTQIGQLPGVNSADRLKLMQYVDQKNNSWEGTTEVRQGGEMLASELKIQPGENRMFLPDGQAEAYAHAHNEYIQKLAELDPAKRRAAAHGIAEEVITHIHQQGYAKQADAAVASRDAFAAHYGPGGPEQWPAKTYAARLKEWNDQIDTLRKQAKGQ